VSRSTESGEVLGRGAALTPSDPAWIGRYRLVRRLGAGGMGLVYLGEAPDGAQVAIKVIRPEYADEAVYRRRFHQEAEAAARVRDPGVARVLDHDTAGASPFLVTEYVPGPSLRDRVEAGGPLTGPELDAFARGVARALAGIHAAGVVHRDLKPPNVILSPAGPRIVDFGIARAVDAVTRYTTTGEIVGSVGWMAPEVLRQQPATPASDIFSWGATVAYAATGRRPFGEGPDIGVAHRVLSGPPPDLAGVPPWLAPLVVAALSSDPRARPTAAALATGSLGAQVDPTRVLDGLRRVPEPTRVVPGPPGRPSPVPSPVPNPVAPRRRRVSLRVLFASAAGVLAVIALLGELGKHPETSLSGGPGSPTRSATTRASTPATKPTTRPTARPTQRRTPPPAPGVLVASRVPAAQDGDVLFTLTDLRCGLTRVGVGAQAQDEPAGLRACAGRVVARNTGRNQHLLASQNLHGPGGKGYASDGALASRYGRKPLEWQVLKPGQSLTTTLVWELPIGVRPVDVEFRGDWLFTLGTRRSLR
jgi:serine/threonine protein kinase